MRPIGSMTSVTSPSASYSVVVVWPNGSMTAVTSPSASYSIVVVSPSGSIDLGDLTIRVV